MSIPVRTPLPTSTSKIGARFPGMSPGLRLPLASLAVHLVHPKANGRNPANEPKFLLVSG